MNSTDELLAIIDNFQENCTKVMNSIRKVIVGHQEIIQHTLIAFLAGGHLLLEGLPGLGKTLLVQTLTEILSLTHNRIQCTPDLMPADILGTHILLQNKEKSTIEFEKGPIFSHIVLVDEINRATPRTQSSLLQAMQERYVTIGGINYPLPKPFMVIATQNPIEMEGTYPLPEAQLDRFFFKLLVNYPNLSELVEIAFRTTGSLSATLSLKEISLQDIRDMISWVRQVYIAEYLVEYIARLILGTQPTSQYAVPLAKKYIQYGASPRGMQSLILGAKVKALMSGRVHVSQEDILSILKPALQHRIIINFEGEAEGISPLEILDELQEKIPLKV